MNDSLAHILKKWDLNEHQDMPIEIPDTNRVMLAKLFAELNYRKGVEVGVARGSYSFVLSTNNPWCKLYSIDPWTLYDGMRDFTNARFMSELEVAARQRLGPRTNIQIIKDFSMEAVKKFDDESLDFVYIDANHEWPYVTQDIFYWAKKVRAGGIVSGHDYDQVQRHDGLCQVKEVVHAYTEAFNINPWFIMDRTSPGRAASWLWVKP